MKKLPFVSLALLLLAYTTFSWLLYNAEVTWLVWAAFAAFILIQAFLLTTAARKFQQFLERWLKSDLGYFSSILLLGLFVLFALAWFHVFGHVLVLASAELLARIDLRRAGYTRIQALILLLVVSLIGLLLGTIAYAIIQDQYPIDLSPQPELSEPSDPR